MSFCTFTVAVAVSAITGVLKSKTPAHVKEAMWIEEDPTLVMEYIADLFKAFGDPTRVHIMTLLQQQELCVGDIAEAVELSQSAISHQLRILKQMHLIKYRREGKNILYSLADDHVRTILEMGLEHVLE